MAVPVLLVTGFLGAGKTTLVNHLLSAGGRRIAAVVNDFGAIDIDAALLGSVSGDVVSLKNGCICCSLQGDLLQTLSTLLRRDPPPDAVVIETSGVSDPAEIVRALLDPVVWREAALDAVVCLADARHLVDDPALWDDRLCRSQLGSADFVVLNKADLVTPGELAAVRNRLRAFKPDRSIHEATQGRVPPELLFSAHLREAGMAPLPSRFSTPGFQSVSWMSDRLLSLPRFQAAVARLAPLLLRAKGIVVFSEQPDTPMLFQLVGTRATVGPAPPLPQGPEAGAARLVFIFRNGTLTEHEIATELAACAASLP